MRSRTVLLLVLCLGTVMAGVCLAQVAARPRIGIITKGVGMEIKPYVTVIRGGKSVDWSRKLNIIAEIVPYVFPNKPGHNFAVNVREVRRRAHGAEVPPGVFRFCAVVRQFRIWHVQSVFRGVLPRIPHRVAAYFMSESARPRVDLHNELSFEHPKALRRGQVKNVPDFLEFDKVVSAAKGSDLVPTALFRTLRDIGRLPGHRAEVFD